METTIGQEIAALQQMNQHELRDKYLALFGEETRSGNRVWIIKRLAWRLQALVEGGLSERARQRAAELATDTDVRTTIPQTAVPEKIAKATADAKKLAGVRDSRLPMPGAVLARRYKGKRLQVKVLENGFEFDGTVFPSLSAVAKAITGSHCNGYLFFGLQKGGDQ